MNDTGKEHRYSHSSQYKGGKGGLVANRKQETVVIGVTGGEQCGVLGWLLQVKKGWRGVQWLLQI